VAAWLLARLAAALAIVFTVVTLVFFAIHLAPGTPFLPTGDRPLDPSVEAGLRARFGLDRPLGAQYVRYLGALARGDLGESFSQQRPVALALEEAIPNTVVLATTALAIDLLLGLAIGAVQAAYARRRLDTLLTHTTLFVYSLPTFWLGLVLLLVFGQGLHWFPVGGVAIGLTGWKLAVAVIMSFAFGALQTIGVGFYAPCMATVYALGMHPKTAFPIMMTATAMLMAAGSARFVKEKAYDRKAAIALTVFGIFGVLLAAFVVKSLPLTVMKWVVLGVVLYTSVWMFISAASKGEEPGPKA